MYENDLYYIQYSMHTISFDSVKTCGFHGLEATNGWVWTSAMFGLINEFDPLSDLQLVIGSIKDSGQ